MGVVVHVQLFGCSAFLRTALGFWDGRAGRASPAGATGPSIARGFASRAVGERAVTGICWARARAAFGNSIRRMPFSRSAVTSSAITSSGSVMRRSHRPKGRSCRRKVSSVTRSSRRRSPRIVTVSPVTLTSIESGATPGSSARTRNRCPRSYTFRQGNGRAACSDDRPRCSNIRPISSPRSRSGSQRPKLSIRLTQSERQRSRSTLTYGKNCAAN